MPVFNSLAKIVAKPIPRIVTPRMHHVADYVTMGVFLGGAAWFWGRNKRAALGALLCGGAELAVVLLTDYRGEMKKLISFRTHREMDYGLAAVAATMPESLALIGDDEIRFFRLQGALITFLGEVTHIAAIPAKRPRSRAA
jgi:hypothetical protein